MILSPWSVPSALVRSTRNRVREGSIAHVGDCFEDVGISSIIFFKQIRIGTRMQKPAKINRLSLIYNKVFYQCTFKTFCCSDTSVVITLR